MAAACSVPLRLEGLTLWGRQHTGCELRVATRPEVTSHLSEDVTRHHQAPDLTAKMGQSSWEWRAHRPNQLPARMVLGTRVSFLAPEEGSVGVLCSVWVPADSLLLLVFWEPQ